jgi:hypothetical protein
MCNNDNRPKSIFKDLLLLVAILGLGFIAFKALRKWYLTLDRKNRKWFWIGFALLYFVGLLVG